MLRKVGRLKAQLRDTKRVMERSVCHMHLQRPNIHSKTSLSLSIPCAHAICMHDRLKEEKVEALHEHKSKLLHPVNTFDIPDHNRVPTPRQQHPGGVEQFDEPDMINKKDEEGGYITMSQFKQARRRDVEEYRRLQKAAQHTIMTLKKILRQKSATVKRLRHLTLLSHTYIHTYIHTAKVTTIHALRLHQRSFKKEKRKKHLEQTHVH